MKPSLPMGERCSRTSHLRAILVQDDGVFVGNGRHIYLIGLGSAYRVMGGKFYCTDVGARRGDHSGVVERLTLAVILGRRREDASGFIPLYVSFFRSSWQ